ncbi:MAG: hypothetical protein KA780_01745 [Prolixibacteraceae bacterium]|nr:hypothetical protein [Prolixibacteraceae bacterium]
MYRSHSIIPITADKYQDVTLPGNYNLRYSLYITVVVFTGIIATIVPFILR